MSNKNSLGKRGYYYDDEENGDFVPCKKDKRKNRKNRRNLKNKITIYSIDEDLEDLEDELLEMES